jgi:hypothetical protein
MRPCRGDGSEALTLGQIMQVNLQMMDGCAAQTTDPIQEAGSPVETHPIETPLGLRVDTGIYRFTSGAAFSSRSGPESAPAETETRPETSPKTKGTETRAAPSTNPTATARTGKAIEAGTAAAGSRKSAASIGNTMKRPCQLYVSELTGRNKMSYDSPEIAMSHGRGRKVSP